MIKVTCNEIVIKKYEVIIDEEVREYLLRLLQSPTGRPESSYDKRNREVLLRALDNPYKPPQVVAGD
jgi:hypothetical protein